MSERRCIGCGKKIEVGDRAMRMVKGKVAVSGFDEDKEWGEAHERCFLLAIGSPSAVLSEIKRQAKKTVKVKTKAA